MDSSRLDCEPWSLLTLAIPDCSINIKLCIDHHLLAFAVGWSGRVCEHHRILLPTLHVPYQRPSLSCGEQAKGLETTSEADLN
jgi:hypothetical protein